MALNLKIIIASTRPGRVGPAVASWVHEVAAAHGGFNVELVDLAEVGLPFIDEAAHPAAQNYEHEHTKAWSKTIAEGDAFVFVTPEYDYFPPATIVNALQVLLAEWKYKPAGVVCYGGVSGGLRSSQELRMLISNVGMMPLPQVVPLPFVAKHLKDGVLSANEHMVGGATGMLNELERWATALRTMR